MSAVRVERRLAAILAADMVGYSRLMGQDETGTLARLTALRRELIDPKIAEHKGRLVKTTGDGLLVEFGSAVDAVRCATEIQRGMFDRNHDAAEDERIAFRVGINLGDVILQDGDLFGDGVNVAARLEALAEPSGICISRTVRDQVRDKLPFVFADLGEQTVKNIARPVRAFALHPDAIAALPAVTVIDLPARRWYAHWALAAAVALLLALGAGAGWWGWSGHGRRADAPPLSVVVLPFANLSHDPEQDYFVDAITDDLTTDLSRIDGSFVIARTTAFTYKGKSVDVKQIGRELGVHYVLEGSVQRLGEQLELNVQLITAESGAHVWADRFNTDRTNLGKVQEEIVGRLARALNVTLLKAAAGQVDQEKNPDARDLIMRGWALYYRPLTTANREQAEQAFEKALELDPQSIGARIGIAALLDQKIARGASKSRDQDLTRAEKLAREAVERDPNSAQAYLALGAAHRLQNRLAESRAELEMAIAFNHNHAAAILQLGITLLYSGEPQAALPYFEQALRLTRGDANSQFFYFWTGFDHLLMKHTEHAVDYFRKACTAAPQVAANCLFLASALGLKGDIDEAKTVLAEVQKQGPENYRSLSKLLGSANGRIGNAKFFDLRKATFDLGLVQAGMPAD